MAASQRRATLEEDFVRTARAKGVLRPWRHTLPAAAGPVVLLVGVQMNIHAWPDPRRRTGDA
jgi:ABC-type dipeptide/oligopeptide/nickel transport system permease component